jgi:molybdate transport system substrate-binding protein
MSLKNAFEEVSSAYTRQTGVPCTLNFAPSGVLLGQIAGGAPIDIFASASQKDMDEAERLGLIRKESRRDFVTNRMVLIAPLGGEHMPSDLEGLRSKEIKRIAAGNPKSVPAGFYAHEAMEKTGLLPLLREKLIYGENVRQVLDYVARGEVDAGLVYASDVLAAKDRVQVLALLPENSHSPIRYPVALIKDSPSEKAGADFIAFLFSDEGRQILEKHGFSPLP